MNIEILIAGILLLFLLIAVGRHYKKIQNEKRQLKFNKATDKFFRQN